MEVWTPHSTRLDVSWNEVPNGYKNGIIMGYKIQYTEMMDNGSVETEDLEPWKRSLSITGLKKFTLYNITVLAYTSKGDGVSYNKVIMTNQDGMFPRTLISRYPMKHCTRVVCFVCVPRMIAHCQRVRIVTHFCDITNSTTICCLLFYCESKRYKQYT